MNIIVSNLSEKRAFFEAQRILLKYLPKISSDSFAGSLSLEALDSLIEALNKKSSKNTSVIIRKVATRERLVVLKIIGNRKKISFNHQYIMSQSQIKEEYPAFSMFEKFEASVLKHVGLVHDLGKYNLFFQNKITPSFLAQGKIVGDPFRHEFLSTLLVLETFQVIETKGQDISDFTFVLKNNIDVWNTDVLSLKTRDECFNFIKNKYNLSRNYINNKYTFDKRYNYQDFYIFALFYLTLTHHRLPLLKLGEEESTEINYPEILNSFDIMLSEFRNDMSYYSDNDIKNNLTFAIENDDTWLEYSKRFDFSNLKLIFSQKETFDFIDIFNFSHLNRNVFIYADHFGSEDKYKQHHKSSNSGIFANSERLKDQFQRGDTLIDHLTHVGCYTRSVLNFIRDFRPSIYAHEYHDIEQNSPLFIPSHGKYAWQNKLSDFFENQNMSGPMLLNLICEAGSGKTIGAIKALLSVNEKLRFTICLPKRSLVFQTSDVYQNQLFINKKNITTLVGGYTAENIFETQKRIENNFLGTDNNQLFDIKDDSKPTYLENTNLKNVAFSTKEKETLTSPIVVSTTDFFVHGIHLSNGGNIGLSLRLMTSDLILDELDDYKVEDYLALSRMVEFAAAYGNKIIIMSATINLALLDAIQIAYKSGCRIYDMRKGIHGIHNMFYMHNFMDKVERFSNKDFDKSTLIDSYRSSFSCYSNNIDQAFKNNSNMVKKHNIKTSNAKTNDIIAESINLHNFNKNQITVDNKDFLVSFGFINCKTVKTAQYIYDLILENRENYKEVIIHPLCIHSQYPTIINACIESELKIMINNFRKSNYSEKFKQALNMNYHEYDKENQEVLFIVVGTSFLETGRDLDFDYTIIDVKSARSYIQTIGRVRRHRPEKFEETNVCLLTQGLDDNKPLNFYKKPGIMDYKPLHNPNFMDKFINEKFIKNFIDNDKIKNSFFETLENDSSNRNLLTSDIHLLNKKTLDLSKSLYGISMMPSHQEFTYKIDSEQRSDYLKKYCINHYYQTNMRFYKNFYNKRQFRKNNEPQQLVGFEIKEYNNNQFNYKIYTLKEDSKKKEVVYIHDKLLIEPINQNVFYLCLPEDIEKTLEMYNSKKISILEQIELFGVMILISDIKNVYLSLGKGIYKKK